MIDYLTDTHRVWKVSVCERIVYDDFNSTPPRQTFRPTVRQ